MKSLLLAVAFTLCLPLVSTPAAAQYPNKPIRLIVPFAAGGASDAAARTVGKALSKSLGQPIVIDNRPGANGAIAAQTIFTAPPDGYSLLWGVGSMVAIPLLQKSAPLIKTINPEMRLPETGDQFLQNFNLLCDCSGLGPIPGKVGSDVVRFCRGDGL